MKARNTYTLAGKRKLGFEATLMPKETLRKKLVGAKFGVAPNLSVLQRFRIQLFGGAFLRWVKPAGYSGAVPVYLVKCSHHGLYTDTPHGYSKYFQCPDCLAEAKEEADKHKFP